MSMTVRELVTKLGFEVDDKKLKTYEDSLKNVRNLSLALTGAAAGAAAALFGITKSAASAAEEIRAQSQITGLGVDEWQRYAFAASQAEVSSEEFSTGMRFLTRNVGEAMRGNKAMAENFAALGISMEEVRNLSRGELLQRTMQEFEKIQDPAKRASLAIDLFGRGGVRMGRFLAGGSKQITEAARVVEAFGFFNDQSAEAGDRAGDAFAAVLQIIRGLKNELGTRLFPIMEGLSKRFVDWAIRNKDVIRSGIDKFVRNLIPLAKTLGLAMLALGGASVVAAVMAAVKLVSSLGSAFLIAWGKALLGPLLIAAAIFAVLVAAEDLWGWLHGKDSLMGRWLGSVTEFEARIKTMVTEVKSALGGLYDWIAGLFTLDFDRALAGQDKFFGSAGKAAEAGINAATGGRKPSLTGGWAGGASLFGPGGFGLPGGNAAALAPVGGSGAQIHLSTGPISVNPPAAMAATPAALGTAVRDAVGQAMRDQFDQVLRNSPR